MTAQAGSKRSCCGSEVAGSRRLPLSRAAAPRGYRGGLRGPEPSPSGFSLAHSWPGPAAGPRPRPGTGRWVAVFPPPRACPVARDEAGTGFAANLASIPLSGPGQAMARPPSTACWPAPSTSSGCSTARIASGCPTGDSGTFAAGSRRRVHTGTPRLNWNMARVRLAEQFAMYWAAVLAQPPGARPSRGHHGTGHRRRVGRAPARGD